MSFKYTFYNNWALVFNFRILIFTLRMKRTESFLLFSFKDVFPKSSKFLLQKFGSTVHKKEKQSYREIMFLFL